ncbi:MAG: hypothetical protein JEY99_13965 [Spirochaetales bacterium]|nr:hypothetical protein [Spirochaetales bacterium]
MKYSNRIRLVFFLGLLFSAFSLSAQHAVYNEPFGPEAIESASAYSSPMENNFSYYGEFLQAKGYYEAGSLQEAIFLLTLILQFDPHPDVYFLLGEFLYEQGDFPWAAETYIAAAQSGYEKSDYAWYKAACCLSRSMIARKKAPVSQIKILFREYMKTFRM